MANVKQKNNFSSDFEKYAPTPCFWDPRQEKEWSKHFKDPYTRCRWRGYYSDLKAALKLRDIIKKYQNREFTEKGLEMKNNDFKELLNKFQILAEQFEETVKYIVHGENEVVAIIPTDKDNEWELRAGDRILRKGRLEDLVDEIRRGLEERNFKFIQL